MADRTAQMVGKGWGGALAQAIVDKGYIYFEIDNRGSPNRGVDFEKRSTAPWARSRSRTRRPAPNI